MNQFWCFNITKVRTVHLGNTFKERAWAWSKDLATLSYQTIWTDCWDVTSVALRLLTQLSLVGLIIVLVSLVKSSTAKYNFDHTKEPIDLTNKRRCPRNGGPKRADEQASFVQKILKGYRDECSSLARSYQYALTEADAKCLYNRLSWSHTQSDLESLDWLNHSVRSFWPSIKTLLYKFVLFDLLRPKKADLEGDPFSGNHARKLARKQAQLSILISTRRKLNQLRDSRERQLKQQDRSILIRFVVVALDIVKFALVHLRQLIMDCVMSLVKPSERDVKQRAAMFWPDHIAAMLRKNLGSKEAKHIIKQPVASQKTSPVVNGPIKDDKAGRRSRAACGRSKTAPARIRPAGFKRPYGIFNGLRGRKVMNKLRNKRLRLVKNINKTYERSMKKKEFQIERIRLGKKFPTINGIRIVEDSDSHLLASHQQRSVDEANMKFITEISYDSDDKFLIQVGSIPWLKRIRLTGFSIQLRVMLTINHTAFSMNKELDVFQTTGDVLFPAINHVQVTLMDVPAIDWTIKRPKTRTKTSNYNTLKAGQTFKARLHSYWLKIKQLADPVVILDSSYLKYLVHCIMLVVMRWFHPFDIKIGSLLYLKTMY